MYPNNRKPLVGAIIVNYKSLEHINTCLDSIKNQELPFSRIIIIDNDTENEMDTVLGTLSDDYEYIRLKYNAGFAKANNIGVSKLADCEWVALVNPDAFLDPAWLKRMIDATRRHRKFSFFASRLCMAADPSRIDGMGDVYHMSGMVWRAGHGGIGNCSNGFGDKEVFSPCAAAALYNRNVFLEAGGFDTDYFCYVEDVDLGFRLRLLGHRCLLVNKAIAHHVGSTSTGGKHSSFSIYHGHRNIFWTYVKNMPPVLFWMFLPMHFALHLFSIFWFAYKGQGKIIINAKIDAVRGLPKMIAKRRFLQRRRKISSRSLFHMINKGIIPDRRQY